MDHLCCKSQSVPQYRQRYNPTFVHEPIFIDGPVETVNTRCTPTFYSTALDTQGYSKQTVNPHKQKLEVRPHTALHKSVYTNYSHERRIQDLNPRCQIYYSSKDKWYDHTKQEILATLKNSNFKGCSKQRKYLNLASDPVFTDFHYGTKSQNVIVNRLEEINPQIVPSKPVQEQVNVQTSIPDQTRLKNEVKQVQTKKIDIKQSEKRTKKDFHRNCGRKNQFEASKRQKNRGLEHPNKDKTVSWNPKFTVVRGNKIDNRL